MTNQPEKSANSICNLIGWLSLCVLVAGLGPNFDPEWRQVWTNMGFLGLLAAVVLRLQGQLDALLRRRERASVLEMGRKAREERLSRFVDQLDGRFEKLSEVLDGKKVGVAIRPNTRSDESVLPL